MGAATLLRRHSSETLYRLWKSGKLSVERLTPAERETIQVLRIREELNEPSVMCEWPRGCVQLKLDFETKHLDAPVLVLRTKNKKALVGKWCTEGPKGVGSRKKEYEYISVPPLRIALSL